VPATIGPVEVSMSGSWSTCERTRSSGICGGTIAAWTPSRARLWISSRSARPDADRTLRVAPDLLPPGRVRLGRVEIEGKPYKEFDGDAMSIQLPQSVNSLNVEVQLVPTD